MNVTFRLIEQKTTELKPPDESRSGDEIGHGSLAHPSLSPSPSPIQAERQGT